MKVKGELNAIWLLDTIMQGYWETKIWSQNGSFNLSISKYGKQIKHQCPGKGELSTLEVQLVSLSTEKIETLLNSILIQFLDEVFSILK